LDEIKAAEQAKLQELVNESNLERDNTIQVLQHGLKRYEDVTRKLVNRVETYRNEMESARVCRQGCHTTITGTELFYNRRISIGAPAPNNS
jgi:hypothetical protein